MSEHSPLAQLLPALSEDRGLATALSSLASHDEPTPDLGLHLPDGARPAATALISGAVSDLATQRNGDTPVHPVVLVMTATHREAEELRSAVTSWMDADTVGLFPSWETLPHERLSPRSDTVGERLAILRRLAHPQDAGQTPLKVLFAPIRSILQPVVKGLGDLTPVVINTGEFYEFESVVAALSHAAYSRVDMVTKRGEFAVRGGIIDVFPPTEDHPQRIEFFGDEVEEIRWFSVADQRSLEDTSNDGSATPTSVYAPPCRELLLTDAVREKARALQASMPQAVDMLERISQGQATEGMESLAPLVTEMVDFLDLLPAGSLSLLIEPEKIRARAEDLLATNEEFLQAAWAAAADGVAAPLDTSQTGPSQFGGVPTLAQTRAKALENHQGWWQFTVLGADPDLIADEQSYRTGFQPSAEFSADVDAMLEHMRTRISQDFTVAVATDSSGSARRVAELLVQAGMSASVVEEVAAELPGQVQITPAAINAGFVAEAEKIAVVSERDLFGRRAIAGSERGKRRSLARKKRNAVDPLELREGDYVVHAQHGIAKFIELQRRKVSTAPSGVAAEDGYREYLVLEYAPSKRGAPGDRLFVPTDQLDQVSQYVGGETPSLSKMGGSDWAQTKSKARRATREIANELIRLYSARMASRGYSFSADTPWQRELEESFPFIETPDQLTAIDEVKHDMQSQVPMDRLISGDVGFGKTEVAVRAAFKAVQDGKQVAVLVPTTLLARQHHETFTERFAGFPITVRPLSRFQTGKQARDTINGVADGSVDVVIGTHRLLADQVQFKDLGLVIVDEEQRFGVEHKEQLKKLRTNVDVLAMSATPIPRTLEMSMTGIRETSTLATAPEERHPVLTTVGPYTDQQVIAAIRREMMREGQVFYVHNRVTSINKVAAHIQQLVPEARVAVAHGKMAESTLEEIMVKFWEKEFDVLVSTTIIETGLDIANANTLIIEDAHRYGLSQLHQLRGRVGRGRERAYAYFLYDPHKPLTETALERLRAVATHNELGSGLKLAQKDLEIRGAGNLLGGEQSGHIAGVGFDLYIRMVGEAVADFKGEDDPSPVEVKVELPVNAHLPHDYVPGERLRLEAYRNLAQAHDDQAIEAVIDELKDRYGDLPEPAENLVAVARLRNVARGHGISEIMLMGKNIKFGPVEELPESRVLRLNRMYPGSSLKPALKAVMVPRPKDAQTVVGKDLTDQPLLQWASELVRNIFPQVAKNLPEEGGSPQESGVTEGS
ncbi:transcription-repair coupling factor [Auritidibacter ignavus]|uniref:transcription-repair coupling factor n=1 Tax=Auritidibacter ignavus TaxID=678932 RepID=UPI00210760EE|nr:transcription-repair coupling factor [Auritidibacter ignavus]